MDAHATLVAHVNSDLVTREQLANIEPTELSTPTFRPVKHLELVETLERSVASLNMKIEHEQFAIRRDGQMLFGVMKIAHRIDTQFVTALGFRHANDRTMSIQIVAGVSVFVCDNMCFRGDSIVLRQKHSHSFSLTGQVMAGVSRWRDHADVLVNEIDALRHRTMSPNDAKAFILDAFVQGIMPLRFMSDVVREWNQPRHEEFAPRTLWSLNNAFTEVQKQMPVSTRFAASQDLGRLCTALVKA